MVSIVPSIPGVDGLSDVVRVLRAWQHEGAPMQLHPGDLGWHWRFGGEATAAAVRAWSATDGSLPSACWTVPGFCGWRSLQKLSTSRSWPGSWPPM